MSKNTSRLSQKEKDRFKDRPIYAYFYSVNILKGRLPEEVESVLGQNAEAAYLYSRNIIKGPLPFHIHSSLILQDHGADGKEWVKKYLTEICGA